MTSERKPFLGPRLVFSREPARVPASTRSAVAPTSMTPDAIRRFRETVLPHMDAAYNFARYLTRDPVASEDIVQEAFLRAYRAFSGFRGGAPRAWLLTIVRNCFLNAAAAGKARAAVFEQSVGDWETGAPPDVADPDGLTPEELLIRRREVATVREVIGTMPEPFRETLVLRELEELSYKEIAALTGAPIGTVMSRLARARGMLADMLMPRLDIADEKGARR